jgi:hypothetical protein
MSGLPTTLPGVAILPRSLYVPVGLGMGVVMLGLSLTPMMDGFLQRLLLFYLGTAIAFILMPLVRRADIPLVAAWVVLLAELAPCIGGELISPKGVAADVAGVLMATAPIFIARLRQVAQGDIRVGNRRATDCEKL